MFLDDFLPVYDLNEVHTIFVKASPSRISWALKGATPSDVPFFRILLGIRSLPVRLRGSRGLRLVGSQSLLEQFLNSGFVPLAEDTHKELVLGLIGQFWKLAGGSFPKIADAEGFLAFDELGYAKAAMNFYIEEDRRGGWAEVSTETRIYATDPIARRKFEAYWRFIRPWSGLGRRTLLKAIKRLAERG